MLWFILAHHHFCHHDCVVHLILLQFLRKLLVLFNFLVKQQFSVGKSGGYFLILTLKSLDLQEQLLELKRFLKSALLGGFFVLKKSKALLKNILIRLMKKYVISIDKHFRIIKMESFFQDNKQDNFKFEFINFTYLLQR